jgi:hypothetical protein
MHVFAPTLAKLPDTDTQDSASTQRSQVQNDMNVTISQLSAQVFKAEGWLPIMLPLINSRVAHSGPAVDSTPVSERIHPAFRTLSSS